MTARHFGLHTRDTMATWPQAAEEQDDRDSVPGAGIVWACALSLVFWTIAGLVWWAVH